MAEERPNKLFAQAADKNCEGVGRCDAPEPVKTNAEAAALRLSDY